jgi:hypothetical protein
MCHDFSGESISREDWIFFFLSKHMHCTPLNLLRDDWQEGWVIYKRFQYTHHLLLESGIYLNSIGRKGELSINDFSISIIYYWTVESIWTTKGKKKFTFYVGVSLTNEKHTVSMADLDKERSPILFREIEITSWPQMEKLDIPSEWPLKIMGCDGEFLHE